MQCTAANTKTSYVCILSGCQLQTSQNQELIYDVPNGHPKDKPTTKLGEIIGIKGIVKRAEQCKCDILLASRIL